MEDERSSGEARATQWAGALGDKFRALAVLQPDFEAHHNRVWRRSEGIAQLGNTWSKGTKRNDCVHETQFDS